MESNNSIKNFFDRLSSFDTETTGVRKDSDTMWQLGFTKKGLETEEVTNPFFVFNDHNKSTGYEQLDLNSFTNKLRTINGQFSEKAYSTGQFDELIHKYKNNSLLSLDESINRTLGNLDLGDILVLQNKNFEDRLLKSGIDRGLIEPDTMDRISSRMRYLGTNNKGEVTSFLQLPYEVEKSNRQANFIYNHELLLSNYHDNHPIVSKYVKAMNRVVDSYAEEFNKKGGAVVVEQMDITKALYANAIDRGLIDKRHSRIGLSLDFLTSSILNRTEKHTALSDSKDTIEIFEKTWNMIGELRSGNISDNTKNILKNINIKQKEEVNNQFIKSVQGILKDFQEKGNTKYMVGSRQVSFKSNMINRDTGKYHKLPLIGNYKKPITDINEAMDSVLKTYSMHDGGETRKQFIIDVLNPFKDKNNTLHTNINKSLSEIDGLKEKLSYNSDASSFAKSKWWSQPTQLFGKEMTQGKKYSIIGGAALLGYMWMKGSPEKKDERSYVSEQFYDEQYLGTEFINFNNRNKHYMY